MDDTNARKAKITRGLSRLPPMSRYPTSTLSLVADFAHDAEREPPSEQAARQWELLQIERLHRNHAAGARGFFLVVTDVVNFGNSIEGSIVYAADSVAAINLAAGTMTDFRPPTFAVPLSLYDTAAFVSKNIRQPTGLTKQRHDALYALAKVLFS